jgi:hypothetical protein
VKAREEAISLGQSLEPDTPFDLYFFDDSGWDPLVTMPETVSVRLRGEIQSKPVKVDYPGGEPAKLSGFGPASNSTANWSLHAKSTLILGLIGPRDQKSSLDFRGCTLSGTQYDERESQAQQADRETGREDDDRDEQDK